MRLKEIKPDCVIHFKTKEEMQAFEEYMRLGLDVEKIWNYPDRLGEQTNCLRFEGGKFEGFCRENYYKHRGEEITEFSDLIMPDLTAEEVLQTMKDICATYSCVECPLKGKEKCFVRNMDFDTEELLRICTKWKEEHEKKEPEVEWGYMFHVYEVAQNNLPYLRHEAEIAGCEDLDGKCEELLKEYVQNHEGKFFGIMDRFCRVKESED